MAKLVTIFAVMMLLSYFSTRKTELVVAGRSVKSECISLTILIIIFSLHCGLRTAYNDTHTYMNSFHSAPTPTEFLSTEFDLTKNPLFYLFQSCFRHYISDNYHLFFFVIALFTMTCFVLFIKRYAHDFIFSMLLFYTLLYLLPFAAMKQCIAMAILTIAITKLLNGRYAAYYAFVVLAALFHTYAIVFIVLPVFLAKPWTIIVYAAVTAVAFIVVTFEASITSFLELSDGFGRDLSAEQLLSEEGMNGFRIAVYGVPPLLSFVFQRRFRTTKSRPMSLMTNMSIISFLFCCMGAVNAANMFGRIANYFVLGTVLSLPWMIDQTFEPKSAKLVKYIAGICYLAFFAVDTKYFVAEYRAITIGEFIRGFFS